MSCSSLIGADSQEYKKLQFNFLKWAASWVKEDTTLEEPEFDLPDLVNLLKVVGYNIVYSDGQDGPDPEERLRCKSHGTKAIISCTISGQRFFMEHPSKICKCTKITDRRDSGDFWEIKGNAPHAREGYTDSGSNLIPSISKEQKMVAKNVFNYMIRFLSNKNFGSETDLSTPRVKGRISDPFGTNTRSPMIVMGRKSLDSKLCSPARYRSLDTLTDKNGEALLPEPGYLLPKIMLPSDEELAQSSQNTKISTGSIDLFEGNKASASAIALIRTASDRLLKALEIINSDVPAKTPSPSNFEVKVSSASRSIQSLICTSKPSTASLTGGSAPDLSKRTMPKRGIRAALKSSSYSLVKANAKSETKLKPTTIPKSLYKKNEKYSHIKSTIPKAAEKKEM